MARNLEGSSLLLYMCDLNVSHTVITRHRPFLISAFCMTVEHVYKLISMEEWAPIGGSASGGCT